jgi:hypothetical protein
MALPDPLSRFDPPHRPDWRSELTTAQFGPMAEDLLAVCLEAAGSGSATIARPIVDRGIDLYLRRLRSLLTIPIQVKAFQHLSPDGYGNLDLPLTDVSDDPNGYLALVHLPSPSDQLYRRLFLIPFVELRERCPRGLIHGRECFSFSGNFSGGSSDLWDDYLLDIDRLPEWLASAPGWMTPIPPAPEQVRPHPVIEGDTLTQLRGEIGRLWTATELERAGGGAIVLAEDRVRLDTVTLLIHDLASRHLAGLHIRTGKITPGRTVHFEVPRPPFFIDKRLYVLLVLLNHDDRVHDFCLLMPSEALPGLGYSETITTDPLTKRFAPYRIPSDQLGSVFLKKVSSKG